MMHRRITIWLLLIFLSPMAAHSQDLPPSADVAAYQLGVIAEAKPGSALNYAITITNYGPSPVKSFYIVDGWTVNAEGIAAFALPTPDPDFGVFKVVGTWQQVRSDQKVFAWLLQGDFAPGATVRFDWKVQVANSYAGGLVNWASILSNGTPTGAWQPREQTTTAPPKIDSADDPDAHNNRTLDGVTVVTDSPAGKGIDMALYQTGLLGQVKANSPIDSTWLITNLGPQPVKNFYVMAGWTLDAGGSSILAQPAPEPNFGKFKVLGRWKQIRKDEEIWLWLLEGDLGSGDSVSIQWTRLLVPTYRGDMINWARAFAGTVPTGEWTGRDAGTQPPPALKNPEDTHPDNDRSVDGLTTVID